MLCLLISTSIYRLFFPSALIISELADFPALRLLAKAFLPRCLPAIPTSRKPPGLVGAAQARVKPWGRQPSPALPVSLIRDIGCGPARSRPRVLRWDNGELRGSATPDLSPAGPSGTPHPLRDFRDPQGTPRPLSPAGPLEPLKGLRILSAPGGTPQTPQGIPALSRSEPPEPLREPQPAGTPAPPQSRRDPLTVPAHLRPPGAGKGSLAPGTGREEALEAQRQPGLRQRRARRLHQVSGRGRKSKPT